jgi:hypothetical protein
MAESGEKMEKNPFFYFLLFFSRGLTAPPGPSRAWLFRFIDGVPRLQLNAGNRTHCNQICTNNVPAIYNSIAGRKHCCSNS